MLSHAHPVNSTTFPCLIILFFFIFRSSPFSHLYSLFRSLNFFFIFKPSFEIQPASCLSRACSSKQQSALLMLCSKPADQVLYTWTLTHSLSLSPFTVREIFFYTTVGFSITLAIEECGEFQCRVNIVEFPCSECCELGGRPVKKALGECEWVMWTPLACWESEALAFVRTQH